MLHVYYNHRVFNSQDFDGSTMLTKVSKIETNTVDNTKPNWAATFIERNKIIDDTGLLQLGFSDEKEFESLKVRTPQPSTMNRWPTRDNPNREYRISGTWIELGQVSTTIER